MNIEKLSCYLVRERTPLTTTFHAEPESIAEFCSNTLRMTELPKEQVVCLHTNSKCKVVGYEIVSVGGTSSSMAEPSQIFRSAICDGSVAIILVHNHPSGDVEPSGADNKVTYQIKVCGKLLGIQLLDHIILGTDRYSYHSYKECGYEF